MEWLGPLKLYLIETCPEAKLIKLDGIKKGLIFLEPLFSNKIELSYIVDNPPIPDPIITPDLAASISLFTTHPNFY